MILVQVYIIAGIYNSNTVQKTDKENLWIFACGDPVEIGGRITSLQLTSCRHFGTRHKGDSFNNGHRKDSSTLGKVPEGSSCIPWELFHIGDALQGLSEDFIVCLYTQRLCFQIMTYLDYLSKGI